MSTTRLDWIWILTEMWNKLLRNSLVTLTHSLGLVGWLLRTWLCSSWSFLWLLWCTSSNSVGLSKASMQTSIKLNFKSPFWKYSTNWKKTMDFRNSWSILIKIRNSRVSKKRSRFWETWKKLARNKASTTRTRNIYSDRAVTVDQSWSNYWRIYQLKFWHSLRESMSGRSIWSITLISSIRM